MSASLYDDVLPLDGNAAAGLFADLFAVDVTAAVLTCNNCGSAAEIGAIRVYGGAMGAILRCIRCDNAVLRLARTPAGAMLDMRGAMRLKIAQAE